MLAVPKCAVRLADLEPAGNAVATAWHPALFWTTAVFGAELEALARSGGGAARRGARLALLSAVFDAVLRSVAWTGAASVNLALSITAMQGAEAACLHKVDAVLHFAHFRAATAMQGTPSSCFSSNGAIAEGVEPIGIVFHAQPTSTSCSITPCSSAEPECTVLLAKSACISEPAAACSRASLSVGGMYEAHPLSWPRISRAGNSRADPIGTVLGARKSTRNGSRLAAYPSADAVYTAMLVAVAAFLLRIGGTIACFAFA